MKLQNVINTSPLLFLFCLQAVDMQSIRFFLNQAVSPRSLVHICVVNRYVKIGQAFLLRNIKQTFNIAKIV